MSWLPSDPPEMWPIDSRIAPGRKKKTKMPENLLKGSHTWQSTALQKNERGAEPKWPKGGTKAKSVARCSSPSRENGQTGNSSTYTTTVSVHTQPEATQLWPLSLSRERSTIGPFIYRHPQCRRRASTGIASCWHCPLGKWPTCVPVYSALRI